jgi:hypothetical protein
MPFNPRNIELAKLGGRDACFATHPAGRANREVAQLNRTRLSPDHERYVVNRRCSVIAGVLASLSSIELGSATRSAVMDDLDLVGATAVSAQWLVQPAGDPRRKPELAFRIHGQADEILPVQTGRGNRGQTYGSASPERENRRRPSVYARAMRQADFSAGIRGRG